jgi:cytochrome c biogenesis protein
VQKEKEAPLQPEGEGVRRKEATAGAPPGLLKGLGNRFWRFFTSVRLAVILILILTTLILIGTLLVQVPPDVKQDPSQYGWWLDNVARSKVGILARPLAFLGFFDVYHSLWFLGAGSLLIINITVCSINRWKEIRSAVFSRRIRLADRFYETGGNQARFGDLSLEPQEAAAVFSTTLRERGYRVRQENNPDAVYLAADKNRFFRLGTYLNHLSIILLIVGFLLGSYLGFRNRAFMVPEGSIREVGYGTNLSLKLEYFVDEYWPEGPPKDYRSEVVLYENGVEVKRGTIRVNHPLSYKGVRFYQSFFGPAAVMEVRDREGEVVFKDGVPLGWVTGKEPFQRPTGMFNIPGSNLLVYVVGPSSGYFDPLIKAGQVRIEIYRGGTEVPIFIKNLDHGVPADFGDYTITFLRERQFSGFQVSRDPGNPLIWTASTLFVLGVAMVFYFPHRQVWALARRNRGRTELLLRTTSTRSFAVASEFDTIAKDVGEALSRAQGNKG